MREDESREIIACVYTCRVDFAEHKATQNILTSTDVKSH